MSSSPSWVCVLIPILNKARRKVLRLLILPLQQVLVVPPDPLLCSVQTLLRLSEPHGAIVVNSCSVLIGFRVGNNEEFVGEEGPQHGDGEGLQLICPPSFAMSNSKH